MGAGTSVYDRVIIITASYFGPSAGRIIDRQIRNQLHKTPEEISKQDLLQLVDWIQSAVSLLTDDRNAVRNYISQLQRL